MSDNKGLRRIFFLAGEQSGDLHGSLVIKHLRQIFPEIKIDGIGGPMMQAAGMNCIHSSDELAVIGFVEVLKNIRHLYCILNDVRRWLTAERPDMVVLIDYPGFNQRIAEIARSLNIHVLYYICPQVWAWHASRVKKITELINEAVVVFPFEVDIWAKAGATVNWFGHPLVGVAMPSGDPEDLKRTLQGAAGSLISLLPGSRTQEIHYILPVLLDAAEIILKQRPDTRFLLPVAGTIDDSLVLPHLKGRDLPLTMLRGQTYDAIAVSDLCLVASGTATLETAIIGTPMVVVYKVNWLTSLISKFVIQAEHIGLPNVIAGRRIVPEFIRGDFKPSLIAAGALDILNSPEKQTKMREELDLVKKSLGEPGASSRVAAHIAARIQELHR
ncbi:MAG: lipid-A-disaccharide synthase [Candidatus Riflebacteria bacterium]|nr:lipid-A-disaccharide synthase [Candidatus Riflebacteria bacterium]